MVTIAQSLASFLEKLTFHDLSDEVVLKAKMAVLDTLGAALAGSRTPESESMVRAVTRFDEGERAALWGHGMRASIPTAALVNGTSAHARELDDWGAGLHSGAVVIPTVMALGEATRLSGKELLTAVVAGYEVMIRAAKGAGGDVQYERGWHPTGTCGTFGAAAAAGKALNLSAQQMAWALGLAGSFTGGTLAFLADGAMSKRFHPGKAAETGIMAAFLAREGFTGPAYVFEADPGGFLSTYGGQRPVTTLLLDGFGKKFMIMTTGFKPYASCRDVHAAIDAAFEIREHHRPDIQEVHEVLVESTHEAVMLCGKQRVSNTLEAQMSIPYGVAVALLDGEADLSQYSSTHLADPEILDLASRVRVVASPKFDGMEHCAALTVHLTNGEKYSARVDIPKGDPRNPMSRGEVRAKFRGLASLALPLTQVEQIAEAVESLEELEQTKDLCRLLQGNKQI